MSSSVSSRRATRIPSSGSTRRARLSRWAAAFVVVAVLHGLAALWFARHREIAQPAPPTHVPVQIALLKPQPIERSATPPAAAHAQNAPHAAAPKPHPAAPHTLTAIAHAPHPPVPAQPADTQASAPASASAAVSGASATQAAQQGNGVGNHPAAPPGPTSHGVKFSVPPSGDLSYDTFYNGMRNQPGTIHWSSDGQRYQMVVSVPLPFIGTFSWTSEGRVDAFGLAPDKYIEKRGHRPQDVTLFNHDNKQVSFTRTPNTVPLPDGAQDRFSMVMQLASLVRGDPDAYKPGVTREFFVVDNDSGENWPVTTVGDESVGTDHGFVAARHFMRLPRHDGDKRRIDVWLAPSLGWLPVRLVQTEPNGTQFELVWRGPLALPSEGVAAGASNDANGAAGTPATNGTQNGTAGDNANAATAAPSAASEGASLPAAPAAAQQPAQALPAQPSANAASNAPTGATAPLAPASSAAPTTLTAPPPPTVKP